jgi:hypothetical protein
MNNSRLTNRQKLFVVSCLLTMLAPGVARGEGSISFNGQDSKLAHTSADVLNGSNDITICAWVYPVSSGEGGEGVVVALDESASGVALRHDSGSTLALWANFGTTDGKWVFPVKHNKWSAVAVTYNKSSTSNSAQARVDFVDMTETPTMPAGSLPGVNSGHCVGNINDGSKAWDGRIANVQIFNRILSAAEMDAALRELKRRQ